jgi:hypothetical protein
MDFISTCIIIEELAKVDPGIATIVDVHVIFIKHAYTSRRKKEIHNRKLFVFV